MQNCSCYYLFRTLPWLLSTVDKQVKPSSQGFSFHLHLFFAYLSTSSCILLHTLVTPTYTHLANSYSSLFKLDLLLKLPFALFVWQENPGSLSRTPFAAPQPPRRKSFPPIAASWPSLTKLSQTFSGAAPLLPCLLLHPQHVAQCLAGREQVLKTQAP